jgi:S1-C subfamily serine protease
MSRYLIVVAALSSLPLLGSPLRADDEDQQRAHRHMRTYLGVVVDQSFRGEEQEGVRVQEVIPDSPAARAGLRPGDIITQIGRRPVEDFHDLVNAVSRWRPGERANIQVQREGRDRNLRVTLGERGFRRMPGADEESRDFQDRYGRWQGESTGDQGFQQLQQRFRQLESRLQDIQRQGRGGAERGESQRELRQLVQRLDQLEERVEEAQHEQTRYGRQQRGAVLGVQTRQWRRQFDGRQGGPAEEGVQVTAIESDSPAAEAGLRRGDIITRVDDRNVATTQELRQALQRSGGREATLQIVRGGRQMELNVRPEERSATADRYQRLHDRIDRLEDRVREMERER